MALADDLARLADKYATLARLRARREALAATGQIGFEASEGVERRAAFRRVASEFPGALRELEQTPVALLERKAQLIEDELGLARLDPARTAPARRWVAVVLDFHATLRELLAIKLWLARRVPSSAAISADDALACCEWHAGWQHARGLVAIDSASPAGLEAVRRPPGGRVLPLVWEALAARHGLPPRALERAVFGMPSEDETDEPAPRSIPG